MADQPTTVTLTLPTNNIDGSPVAAGELVDVDIGFGPASNGGNGVFVYPNIAEAVLTQVDPASAPTFSFPWADVLIGGAVPALPIGVTFIAARMKTKDGTLSKWSTEVQYTVPGPVPSPPTALAVS